MGVIVRDGHDGLLMGKPLMIISACDELDIALGYPSGTQEIIQPVK